MAHRIDSHTGSIVASIRSLDPMLDWTAPGGRQHSACGRAKVTLFVGGHVSRAERERHSLRDADTVTGDPGAFARDARVRRTLETWHTPRPTARPRSGNTVRP